jgi:hypothetical protein
MHILSVKRAYVFKHITGKALQMLAFVALLKADSNSITLYLDSGQSLTASNYTFVVSPGAERLYWKRSSNGSNTIDFTNGLPSMFQRNKRLLKMDRLGLNSLNLLLHLPQVLLCQNRQFRSETNYCMWLAISLFPNLGTDRWTNQAEFSDNLHGNYWKCIKEAKKHLRF